MAKAHRLRFVDSISSSPTVLLDLHDGDTWSCLAFEAPPPPLTRAVASSMLVDGDHISASSYSNRTLSVRLKVNDSSQDDLATEQQTLARLLDSDSSILEFKRDGATEPVFFRMLRADLTTIEQMISQVAMDILEFEAPAEPFALGLRVDAVEAATVTNDPEASSNGLFIDVDDVQGDVATEPVIWMAPSGGAQLWLASEPDPAGGIYFVQSEDTGNSLGDDTTLAASTDSAMSGSGQNYHRITFSTETDLEQRVTGLDLPTTMIPGDFRILACVRATASGAVYTMQVGLQGGSVDSVTTDEVTVSGLTTTRQHVDLGILPIPAGQRAAAVGYGTTPLEVHADTQLAFSAGNTSGTADLDLDYLVAVPASWSLALIEQPDPAPAASAYVIDGPNDAHYDVSTTSPFTAGAEYAPPEAAALGAIAGGLPVLFPGVDNRLHLVPTSGAKTATMTVSVSYWPKYLYVRPALT